MKHYKEVKALKDMLERLEYNLKDESLYLYSLAAIADRLRKLPI